MSLLLNVPYTYRKDGIYYLQRYVPEDVRQHYKTNRISFSLRTKSARDAMALARSASAKLEAYWHSLRLAYGEVPAQHLVALANSASAALNKWLKAHVSKDIVVHSLRHAMRDRLRAVECPTDIIDQIGGWSRKGVGESYGRGYQVEQLRRWMAKAVG